MILALVVSGLFAFGSAAPVNHSIYLAAHRLALAHRRSTTLVETFRHAHEGRYGETLPAELQHDAEAVGHCIGRRAPNDFSGMVASGYFMSASHKNSLKDVALLCNKRSAPHDVILRVYQSGNVRKAFERNLTIDSNSPTDDIEAVSSLAMHKFFPYVEVVANQDYIVFKKGGEVVAGASCYVGRGNPGCMGAENE